MGSEVASEDLVDQEVWNASDVEDWQADEPQASGSEAGEDQSDIEEWTKQLIKDASEHATAANNKDGQPSEKKVSLAERMTMMFPGLTKRAEAEVEEDNGHQDDKDSQEETMALDVEAQDHFSGDERDDRRSRSRSSGSSGSEGWRRRGPSPGRGREEEGGSGGNGSKPSLRDTLSRLSKTYRPPAAATFSAPKSVMPPSSLNSSLALAAQRHASAGPPVPGSLAAQLAAAAKKLAIGAGRGRPGSLGSREIAASGLLASRIAAAAAASRGAPQGSSASTRAIDGWLSRKAGAAASYEASSAPIGSAGGGVARPLPASLRQSLGVTRPIAAAAASRPFGAPLAAHAAAATALSSATAMLANILAGAKPPPGAKADAPKSLGERTRALAASARPAQSEPPRSRLRGRPMGVAIGSSSASSAAAPLRRVLVSGTTGRRESSFAEDARISSGARARGRHQDVPPSAPYKDYGKRCWCPSGPSAV
ncbi:unnamed protein product [Polarella glacialis]|uniref:Uncharacterized protein n=3 Tax=Polarella glacialis TaxID=89957 RepID=A0A813KK57_POLGL|nr:unnamed protein product [Polarella glacialis]